MSRGKGLAAVVAVALMVVAACSNTGDDDSADGGGSGETQSYGDVTTDQDDENVPVDQPGVTDDEIRVAGFATLTNDVTSTGYSDTLEGVGRTSR